MSSRFLILTMYCIIQIQGVVQVWKQNDWCRVANDRLAKIIL